MFRTHRAMHKKRLPNFPKHHSKWHLLFCRSLRQVHVSTLPIIIILLSLPFYITTKICHFYSHKPLLVLQKIMLYKTLKTTNLQSSKIQGTYFKICALYFKIYGLYFLRQAMCFFTHPAHKKTQPQKTDFIFWKAMQTPRFVPHNPPDKTQLLFFTKHGSLKRKKDCCIWF